MPDDAMQQADPVPILDASGPSNGEAIPDDEPAAIAAIAQAIAAHVRAAAATAPARRDAHAKAHGCVRAIFEVLDDLPDALRVGLFQAPRQFDAWVRLSNGSGMPQPDRTGDGRGMAVKLLGVPGSPSGTQDFLMINYPAFFVRNAADYLLFTQASPQWEFFIPGLNPLHFRLHELGVAREISGQTVTNPLNIRYWSMTPSRFGQSACKFSARPRPPLSPYVAADTDDYLRANMAAHLAQGPASFDFMVQLRADPDSMPIEDPTIAWDETLAPFVPVARITVPPQSLGSAAQQEFCENLSFTPWHGIPEHRPLGGINRVRRTVYETISTLRHGLNGAPRREPV